MVLYEWFYWWFCKNGSINRESVINSESVTKRSNQRREPVGKDGSMNASIDWNQLNQLAM